MGLRRQTKCKCEKYSLVDRDFIYFVQNILESKAKIQNFTEKWGKHAL